MLYPLELILPMYFVFISLELVDPISYNLSTLELWKDKRKEYRYSAIYCKKISTLGQERA